MTKSQRSLLSFFQKQPAQAGDNHRKSNHTATDGDQGNAQQIEGVPQKTASPAAPQAGQLALSDRKRPAPSSSAQPTSATQQRYPAPAKGSHDGMPPEKRHKRMQEILGDGEGRQEKAYREVATKFAWLGQAADAAGHRPSHPDYDPRTLTVPAEVFAKLSDSQKQYWGVKRKYRDVLLFFKVGKFYELYEDDAQVAHEELDWRMTIAGVGHCRQVGCPESGINEAVARLTSAGYKVGRVEQLETAAEAKAKRGPKACIRRELTRIHTPATSAAAMSADAVHLMALWESEESSSSSNGSQGGGHVRVGFAFLDAVGGRFYLGAQRDDCSRAHLAALLAQVAPREVVVARGTLSAPTRRLLAMPPAPLQVASVAPGTEFPSAEGAEEWLDAQGFMGGRLKWPAAVSWAEGGAQAALGALLVHLKRLKADAELATAAQVVPYETYSAALRMDGPSLANLEVLAGSQGGPAGSLLRRLDNCATAGGRRLLRLWLCRPLRDVAQISARHDAVELLLARPQLSSSLRASLAKLPDLDRAFGLCRSAAAAPAAGLPTELIRGAQSQRLAALAGAVRAARTAIAAGRAFLHELQSEDDSCSRWTLAPQRPGSSSSSSRQCEAEAAAPQLLLELLGAVPGDGHAAVELVEKLGRVLSCTAGGSAKSSKKQVVVLDAAEAACQLEGEWEAGWGEAEEVEQQVAATTKLVAMFNRQAATWDRLEVALSTLDVLASFAAFAVAADGPTCRPELVQQGASSGAVLEAAALWHPCATARQPGAVVVPNDLQLGGGDGGCEGAPRAMVVTGPNMGGKSTLLRAACLAVLMAQAGSHVAAASFRLTPADRIFTRLGASDRIMTGESTFMVECAEAAAVLRHASPSSLVVLDELGRGTSTFDGYAIAHATLLHLVEQVNCRLLFATHYHQLAASFRPHPRVAVGHMQALLTGEAAAEEADRRVAAGNDGGHEGGEGVLTFLYKLAQGICPRSYGLQVSAMAGVPQGVRNVARRMGAALEQKLQYSGPGGSELPSWSVELEVTASLLRLLRPSTGASLPKASLDMQALVQLWRAARDLAL